MNKNLMEIFINKTKKTARKNVKNLIFCLIFIFAFLFLESFVWAISWNEFVASYKTASAGTTINLANDITANSEGEKNPFGSPTDKNFTLNGNNHLIHGLGDGVLGLGFVLNDSSITFHNTSFRSFSNNANGGLFDIKNSTLNFTGKAVFDKITATGDGSNGGVIYAEGSKILFTNLELMEFTGNYASLSNNKGGAIYASLGSSISIKNSVVSFQSNQASDSGGAIHLDGGSILYFENSQIDFMVNSATSKGGAISILGGSTVGFISRASDRFNFLF